MSLTQASALIVGQGIAGSVLSWKLKQRGFAVYLIDSLDKASASVASAGLVTPIMGKRMQLAWELDTVLPKAKDFYHEIEKISLEPIFKERTTQRFFANQDDKRLADDLCKEPRYSPYLGKAFPPYTWKTDEWGGISILGGGLVDVAVLLGSIRKYFEAQACLSREPFEASLLKKEEGIFSYKGRSFNYVFFAEGYRVIDNPWFQSLPFRPTKGEILTIQHALPASWMGNILSRRHWLIPKDPWTCCVGATYEWTEDPHATAKSRAELMRAFKAFLPEAFMPVILEQRVGIRSALPDTLPCIGEHPIISGLFLFNGFASKACLLAPALADRLIESLLTKEALPKAVSIQRYAHLF